MGEPCFPRCAEKHFFLAGVEGDFPERAAGIGVQVAAEEDQPFDQAVLALQFAEKLNVFQDLCCRFVRSIGMAEGEKVVVAVAQQQRGAYRFIAEWKLEFFGKLTRYVASDKHHGAQGRALAQAAFLAQSGFHLVLPLEVVNQFQVGVAGSPDLEQGENLGLQRLQGCEQSIELFLIGLTHGLAHVLVVEVLGVPHQYLDGWHGLSFLCFIHTP
ncbi:hypothetical protein D9M68_805390 [compost metagenome]